MAHHTPGPWKVVTGDAGYLVEPEASNGGFIIHAIGDYGIERRADADLIASAPDLLSACKAALETMTLEHNVNYEGPYRRCPLCGVCQKATGIVLLDWEMGYPNPLTHKPDCARVKVEAAIAKAEGR